MKWEVKILQSRSCQGQGNARDVLVIFESFAYDWLKRITKLKEARRNSCGFVWIPLLVNLKLIQMGKFASEYLEKYILLMDCFLHWQTTRHWVKNCSMGLFRWGKDKLKGTFIFRYVGPSIVRIFRSNWSGRSQSWGQETHVECSSEGSKWSWKGLWTFYIKMHFDWVSKNQNKVFTTANQERENITRSQSDSDVKTSKLPEARENAGDQVVIGFSYEYN